MTELNKIICGDCTEVLKTFPDKSIDLIFADPPYNAKNIGPNARVYSEGIMQLPEKKYKKFCKDWFREANRIAKTIVLTPGIANVCFYPQPKWIICWHKPAACSFNRFGGYNAWEPIMIYGKIAKGKKMPQDYILFNTVNSAKGIEKKHPCPKPIGLIEILIDKFSLEGDIVLDPFLGSGTTAVVCKDLNRNYVGIEIIKEYCDIAEKRIKSISNKLF